MRKIIVFTIASIMLLGTLANTAQAGTYYYVTGRNDGYSPRTRKLVHLYVRSYIYQYWSTSERRTKFVVKDMWSRAIVVGGAFYVNAKNQIWYSPAWNPWWYYQWGGAYHDRDVTNDTGWIYGGHPDKTFYANGTAKLRAQFSISDGGAGWNPNSDYYLAPGKW